MTLADDTWLRNQMKHKGITPARLIERAEQNPPDNWKRGPVAALKYLVNHWNGTGQTAADHQAVVDALQLNVEVTKMTENDKKLPAAIAATPHKTAERQAEEAELRAQLASYIRPPSKPAVSVRQAEPRRRETGRYAAMRQGECPSP